MDLPGELIVKSAEEPDAFASNQDRVLGLFAKQPIPGQVKPRLAAATSAEWAAGVATAFLLDMLDKLAIVAVRRVLAFAPEDAGPDFNRVAQDRFTLVVQTPGDLGQRMAAFFTQQFRDGAATAVLLGTDSPTVPLEFIERAFQELEHADVVLGPAADGGYYLIGCSRRLPLIFDGIVWSR